MAGQGETYPEDRRAFEHRASATELGKQSLPSELPALGTQQFARVANKSVLPYLRCLLPLLALLLGLQAAQAAVLLQDGATPLQLGPQLSYLLDSQQQLTPQQAMSAAHAARYRPVTQQTANFGYQRGSVWLRVEIENRSAQREWLIGVNYPQIDFLDCYLLSPNHCCLEYWASVFHSTRSPGRGSRRRSADPHC